MTAVRPPLKSMLHAAVLCLTALVAPVAIASSAQLGIHGCEPRLLGTGLASGWEQIQAGQFCGDGWATCEVSATGGPELAAVFVPQVADEDLVEGPHCFDWAAAYGLTQAELYPGGHFEAEEPEYETFVIK